MYVSKINGIVEVFLDLVSGVEKTDLGIRFLEQELVSAKASHVAPSFGEAVLHMVEHKNLIFVV